MKIIKKKKKGPYLPCMNFKNGKYSLSQQLIDLERGKEEVDVTNLGQSDIPM